jgi:hypothetical protein
MTVEADRPYNLVKKIDMVTAAPPVSRSRLVESTEGAMQEYRAKQAAELAQLARLREMRLAADAKAASEKAKRKPGGKGKR